MHVCVGCTYVLVFVCVCLDAHVCFCMCVHCVYTYERVRVSMCVLSVSHMLTSLYPEMEGRSTRRRRLQGSGPQDLLG